MPSSESPLDTTSLFRLELDNTLSQLKVRMAERIQKIMQTSLQAILDNSSSVLTISLDLGPTTEVAASFSAQITNGIFSQNTSSILTR